MYIYIYISHISVEAMEKIHLQEELQRDAREKLRDLAEIFRRAAGEFSDAAGDGKTRVFGT